MRRNYADSGSILVIVVQQAAAPNDTRINRKIEEIEKILDKGKQEHG